MRYWRNWGNKYKRGSKKKRMNSIFVDANILLDLIDIKRLRHYKSKYVLKRLLSNNFRIGISEDMIQIYIT